MFLILLLNFIVSWWAFHNIPNAISSGRSCRISSSSFEPDFLSVLFTVLNTSLLMLRKFDKLNPPLLHSSLTALTKFTAAGMDEIDLSSLEVLQIFYKLHQVYPKDFDCCQLSNHFILRGNYTIS